jgi:hypothetical protein
MGPEAIHNLLEGGPLRIESLKGEMGFSNESERHVTGSEKTTSWIISTTLCGSRRWEAKPVLV